jgi:hypothetical protein
MWAFGNYPSVKGETNMKFFITSNKQILDEVYSACLLADDIALETRNKDLQTVDIDLSDI